LILSVIRSRAFSNNAIQPEKTNVRPFFFEDLFPHSLGPIAMKRGIAMFNKPFFFSLGICTLVLLIIMSSCTRINLADLFPEKDVTAESGEGETTHPPAIEPPQPLPPQPPSTSDNYTWYVSSSGNNANSGTDLSSPLGTVSEALNRIKSIYKGGRWPTGVSAVIVISGKLVGNGSYGANDSMVDVSGVGNYPHIILKGDPANKGILDANSNKSKDGRVLYIANNKVTLSTDLTLTGGYKLWGGGVCIGAPGGPYEGEFIMDGGEISGNIGGTGGGVLIYRGSMIMTAGIIKNNHNNYDNSSGFGSGSGISVYEDTTLSLMGGTIMENGRAPKTLTGGGVHVDGTLNMIGGEILRNTSVESGGGVYVEAYGVFNMSGGNISANTSQKDGGVGLSSYGAAFNKTGGTISGNIP
jgi:hypothetical protein